MRQPSSSARRRPRTRDCTPQASSTAPPRSTSSRTPQPGGTSAPRPTGDSTCHSVTAGTTSASLTGLTEHTLYTYKAYDASGCTSTAIATLSFTTGSDELEASAITDSTATLTLSNHTGNWWLKRTTPADTTCKSKGTTATESLTNLIAGKPYTYEAYNDSTCTTRIAQVTFTTLSLAAENIDTTDATLHLEGYTGSWYYKANKAPDNSCQGPVSGHTVNRSNLAVNTAYLYEAYSDSACTASKLLATAGFRTAVTASNLSETGGSHATADRNSKAANGFTTGRNPGGYTLSQVEIAISKVKLSSDNKAPAALVVALHNNATSSVFNDDEPGTLKATLSGIGGGSPTSAGTYTYTCSTGCDLEKDTTYHIVLSAPGSPTGSRYEWSKTSSLNETLTPVQNGWSIGIAYYISTGNWAYEISGLRFEVAAVAEPSLSATPTGDTTATLKAVSYTDGAWWYKRTAGTPADATCHSVAAGTTSVSLSGMTEHNEYTYKAYDEPGCDSADEFGAITFTQTNDVLTASKMTWTTARLTLTGNTGNWWLKQTSPVDASATCKSMGTKSAENLTGLTQSTAYTYKAYSGSTCTSEIASEDFLTAGPITISNRTESSSSALSVGWSGFLGQLRRGMGFETGSKPGGYTLKSVTVELGPHSVNSNAIGQPKKLHAKIYTNIVNAQNENVPNTLVKDLGIKNPAGGSAVTWTCTDSGSACDLTKDTTYHLVLEADEPTSGSSSRYNWKDTSSDNETNTPSSEDWKIKDESARKFGNAPWLGGINTVGLFSLTVEAKGDPFIGATDITTTTATLNIVNHKTAWWYKRTGGAPDDSTCHSVAAGTTTASLSSLLPGVTYSYKAWKKAGCNSTADELGSDTFTTDGESVSNLDEAAINNLCVAGTDINVRYECGTSFTTGSATEYLLEEIIVRIYSKSNSPGDIRVTLHADSSGSPASRALYTLSGSNPTNTNVKKVDYAYTCSECYLQPSTTYWLVLAAPNATGNFNRYTWLLNALGRGDAVAEREWLDDRRRQQAQGNIRQRLRLSVRLVRREQQQNRDVPGVGVRQRGGSCARPQRHAHIHRNQSDAHVDMEEAREQRDGVILLRSAVLGQGQPDIVAVDQLRNEDGGFDGECEPDAGHRADGPAILQDDSCAREEGQRLQPLDRDGDVLLEGGMGAAR